MQRLFDQAKEIVMQKTEFTAHMNLTLEPKEGKNWNDIPDQRGGGHTAYWLKDAASHQRAFDTITRTIAEVRLLPKFENANLAYSIQIVGKISGVDTNKTFNDLESYQTFMLEKELLTERNIKLNR